MSAPCPPVRPAQAGSRACLPFRDSRLSRRRALRALLLAVRLGLAFSPGVARAGAEPVARGVEDAADLQSGGAGTGEDLVRDPGSPGAGSRGMAQRDGGQGDGGPRDSGLRDSGPRDSGPHDSGPHDSGQRGADTVDTTGPTRLPDGPGGSGQDAPVPGAAGGAGATDGGAGPDVALDGQVIGTALAFIAPRSLDPTTVPGLALWGLQGLATLDPSLRLRTGGGVVRLDLEAPGEAAGAVGPGANAGAGGDAGFVRPFPPEVDASAWGGLSADALRWAWERSATLRAAGGAALLQGYFDEVFSHLDPYSRYVPPAGAEHVRDRLAGQVGVGVELARLGANLVLATVAANGPAAQAGLRAGERLLAVDGVGTQGAAVAAVAASLVGEDDTTVRLRVAGADGRTRVLVLHRAVVPPETVFAERRRGVGGVLLSLRITAFTADTAQRLSQELEDGLDARVGGAQVSGLVIDLRGDRGGLLRQAVTAVALLLDQGIVATTVGRDPEASRVWRVQGGDLANRLPIVVLVDGRTASAAEIMAAGLADQRRAVVVGSATTGKGVVQTLTELPDGGELFVTWSRVLAPRGWPLQGLGVLPQLCTSLGAEATARQLRSLEAGGQELAAALRDWRAARAPLDAHAVAEMRGACPAAEGRDGDFETARALLGHPAAYAAALLPP